jgi:hypothetical protein
MFNTKGLFPSTLTGRTTLVLKKTLLFLFIDVTTSDKYSGGVDGGGRNLSGSEYIFEVGFYRCGDEHSGSMPYQGTTNVLFRWLEVQACRCMTRWSVAVCFACLKDIYTSASCTCRLCKCCLSV